MTAQWGTELKALCRSKNIAQMSFLASRCVNHSLVVARRAVSVDFPDWNPHWKLDNGWFLARCVLTRVWKCLSSILLSTGSSEICWLYEGHWCFDALGMQTIEEVFQGCGKCPLHIERLNNFTSTGATFGAADFCIRAETPSGPLALVVSREFSMQRISS